MHEESERIIGAILHVARKSGSLVTADAARTGSAVLEACAEWELRERDVVIPELKDAAAWVSYELKILQLGRALDFVMRKLGCWKGRGPLLDAAARVVAEPCYGRGRQSFAGAMGEHGEGAYGVELAALLTDDGMAGYAVKALHRGANGEFLDLVLPLSDAERPWVRSAARAYAAEFSASRKPPSRRSRRAPPP